MKNEKLRVPKLRFEEFSGEWEERELSELGSFKNGLNKSKEDFGFGYPFVNLMDVFGKDIVKNEKFDLVNANKKDLELYNLIKGDVLFIRSSVKREGVGETILVLDDLKNTTYSGFLIRFRENSNSFDLLFKKYCFKTKIFRNKLLSLSTTSANTNINQESLNILKLNLPQKQEQEKIASFLSSIDKKINQLSKKDELLQNYKKAMMQKIFSQKLRFSPKGTSSQIQGEADGSDYPKWEEKKLNKVFDIFQGFAFSSKDSVTNGIKWVKIANVGIKEMKKDNLSYLPFEFKEKYQKFLLKKDDYVIALTRPILNGKLKISMIDNFFDDSFLNQRVGKLITKNNSTYVYYLLQTKFIIDSIELNIFGSEPPNFSMEQLKNIKVFIPSLEEQTKIANFLSSIDKKIELVQKQLEKTKEFKKALLQQMFV